MECLNAIFNDVHHFSMSRAMAAIMWPTSLKRLTLIIKLSHQNGMSKCKIQWFTSFSSKYGNGWFQNEMICFSHFHMRAIWILYNPKSNFNPKVWNHPMTAIMWPTSLKSLTLIIKLSHQNGMSKCNIQRFTSISPRYGNGCHHVTYFIKMFGPDN